MNQIHGTICVVLTKLNIFSQGLNANEKSPFAVIITPYGTVSNNGFSINGLHVRILTEENCQFITLCVCIN